jgi:Zn-dependent protease with chaperone function
MASLSASVLAVAVVGAQTRITPPPNKYSLQEDVQVGEEAAAQARQQLPIMRDEIVTSYVRDVGRRLVEAIPPELQHPEFHYTFEAVNVREINAFALPGGPMFVNRGMLEAAHDEGEAAGVMAHELSHVVLRHGTAQASKASRYQMGQLAGAVLGAIIGGPAGAVVAQGTQFGIGTAFLRFSREYERQADIEGTHIMARAGYDPRDLANMFKTIENEGGSNGPAWLSDHPNPGNRYDYIIKEAGMLRVDNPIRDGRAFDDLRAHLRTLPRAPTTEEATRAASTRGSRAGAPDAVPTGRVEPPSPRYTEYTEGDYFRISVPSNWRELQETSAVTFAPAGALGRYKGQSVFTHGVEIGILRNETHDLRTATDELIGSLGRGNPNLSRSSAYRDATVGGRVGIQTTLGNVSDASGRRETIQIASTLMRNGNLLYVIAVAPENEFGDYLPVFQRIVASIRLMA